MRRTRTGAVPSVALVAALLLGAGCGDDTSDDLSRTATSLEDAARKAGDAAADKAGDASSAIDEGVARVQAEAFRLQVMNITKNDKTRFAFVTVLRDAAKDLPGSANVSGITDTDGDGKDDDGKVEVTVDTSKACVTVSSTDIDVSGRAC